MFKNLKLNTKIIGKKIIYYSLVSSTNDVAKDMIKNVSREEDLEGLVIIAEKQTQGRGRRGRYWVSPAGGLWMSLFLKEEVNPQLLVLLSAVGVVRAIKITTSILPQIKWPNDVLIGGKKVAGILAEKVNSYLILGIGVNVNIEKEEFPKELRSFATSLKEEEGKEKDLKKFGKELIEELDAIYIQTKERDFEDLLSEWKAQDITLGNWVKVIADEEEWEGLAEGIDENGYLIIKDTCGNYQKILSGDVSIPKEVFVNLRSEEYV